MKKKFILTVVVLVIGLIACGLPERLISPKQDAVITEEAAPTLTTQATTTSAPVIESTTPPMPTDPPAPTATSEPAESVIECSLVASESGSVRSNGAVSSALNVGDTAGNIVYQAFLSFDISGIPAQAIIKKLAFDLSDYKIVGKPLSVDDGLGDLRMYPHRYGTLDGGDYYAGLQSGNLLSWDSRHRLNSVFDAKDRGGFINDVQEMIGDTRAQFRLQFRWNSNDNGVEDMLVFGDGIKMIVTYILP